MAEETKRSLYRCISEAVIDGRLPQGFSLPKEADDKNKISWADGAKDGVGMYHFGIPTMKDEDRDLMIQAVMASGEGRKEEAEAAFSDLGKKSQALYVIDPLQEFIMDNTDRIDPEKLFSVATHMLYNSTDRECVKFGLSMLELLSTDKDEDLKYAVRTIGLSDEFTLFALYVMMRWTDKDQEIFDLAQHVFGWGRIHAIERLDPVNEKIRTWLLKEGVNNNIMPAYSALTCYEKAGVEELLFRDLSEEDYPSVRDIMYGLMDEGPVQGISAVERGEDVVLRFLSFAERYATDYPDYQAVRGIRIHFENVDRKNKDLAEKADAIVDICKKILDTDKCRDAVKAATKEGNGIDLARELSVLDPKDILHLMKEDFSKHVGLVFAVVEDDSCRKETLKLFSENLPLDAMKTHPTLTAGIGADFADQRKLEFLVQALRDYPCEGEEFIETGLCSSPIRTRHLSLMTIEKWVEKLQKPISEISPKLYSVLSEISPIEPDEKLKNRMVLLLK